MSLSSLAQVHHYRGEFTEAITTAQTALETFNEVGDRKGILIAQCNLGELLRLTGQFEPARRVLETTLDLAQSSGIKVFTYPTLCNLGAVEADLGRPEEAVGYLRECLGNLSPKAPQVYRAHALIQLTRVELERENFEAANDAIEEATYLLRELGTREKLGELASLRVRARWARGQLDEALQESKEHLAEANGVERFGRALFDTSSAASTATPDQNGLIARSNISNAPSRSLPTCAALCGTPLRRQSSPSIGLYSARSIRQ